MRLHLTMGLALIALAASAFAATRTPRDSWGKPGVSLTQYHTDALTCGRLGYYHDIANTGAAKAFVRGSRELDTLSQSGWQAPPASIEDPTSALVGYANRFQRIREQVDPERRYCELRILLQSIVDDCLVAHGYRRFHLSDAQRHRLGKLAIGSEQRRDYMHQLASDPDVLSEQAEWYVGKPPRYRGKR